jgi:hypothetical protein
MAVSRSWLSGRGSIEAHARFLDDLSPAGDVVADQLRELLGRAAEGIGTFVAEPLLQLRLLQRLVELGVELGDRVPWAYRPARGSRTTSPASNPL